MAEVRGNGYAGLAARPTQNASASRCMRSPTMLLRTTKPASNTPAVMTMLATTACRMKASLIRRGSPSVTALLAMSFRLMRDIRHPIASRLHRMQQLLVERFVDRLAQVVQVTAQGVGVRQTVAPYLPLYLLTAYHAW